MNSEEFWHLGHVSDAGLRSELSVLLRTDARTEARIVAHLAEIDRRQLYLKDGYSCLFNYCQGELGLSESQAFHRMTAARIARRYPVVFGMLERRAIHLSNLCLLRDFLTPENHSELLRLASGQTKRRLTELLAARFPGESAAQAVRKLPTGRVTPLLAAPRRSGRVVAPPSQDEPSTGLLLGPTSTHLPFDPVTGEVFLVASDAPGGSDAESAAVPATSNAGAPTESNAELAPRAEVRYRIQFDASSALKAKLELARALSSHSNPRGDLETLFDRALDAYVEQLQKRRFAKVQRPRTQKSELDSEHPTARTDSSASRSEVETGTESGSDPVQVTASSTAMTRSAASARASAQASASASASSVRADATEASGQERFRTESYSQHWRGRRSERRRHLSHGTRRAVVERDGLRCSFVAASGKRCDEQAFLQFDHEQLWARWSSDEPDNLRMLCAFHNHWLAECELGADHVARRIAERSTGASSPRSTLVRGGDRAKNRERDVRKEK